MHKSLWLLIILIIAIAPAQAQSFLLTTDNPDTAEDPNLMSRLGIEPEPCPASNTKPN